MTEWTPDNRKVPWNPNDPEELRRRTAWSVATSCAIETGEQPLDIYNRLLQHFKKAEMYEDKALDESSETK